MIDSMQFVAETKERFHINTAYANCVSIGKAWRPIGDFISAVSSVFSWETPWQSFMALVAWVVLVLHPHYIMPVIHLGVLCVIFKNYVVYKYRSLRAFDTTIRKDESLDGIPDAIPEERGSNTGCTFQPRSQACAVNPLVTWCRA